MGLTFTV